MCACCFPSCIYSWGYRGREVTYCLIHDYYHDKMSQNCSECRKFRWQYPYHRIEEVADLVDHSGAMLAVFKRKRGVTDGEIKALWQEMGLGDT
mmetsp:Transcript_20696/g.30699  ORF Transcript_20696/g.30699 Transcript_20696/m.30699 type:complete len:93 (+) Transcript_20696:625-903(+)